jgi:hypothetical protein
MKTKNKTIRFSNKVSIWHYNENDIIKNNKNIPRDNYIIKNNKNIPRDNDRDSTNIGYFILWFILFLIIYKQLLNMIYYRD